MALLRSSASLSRLLWILMGFCFVAQVAVAAPSHLFHGAQHHKAEFGHSRESPRESQFPEGCRCDLCFSLRALDSASVSEPPSFELRESAFAPFAIFHSFVFSEPSLLSLARGPPFLA